MLKSYKVKYKIQETKNSIPFFRMYCFSCPGGKRQAMQLANDILCDYIVNMHFYVGSIEKITEIK